MANEQQSYSNAQPVSIPSVDTCITALMCVFCDKLVTPVFQMCTCGCRICKFCVTVVEPSTRCPGPSARCASSSLFHCFEDVAATREIHRLKKESTDDGRCNADDEQCVADRSMALAELRESQMDACEGLDGANALYSHFYSVPDLTNRISCMSVKSFNVFDGKRTNEQMEY